MKAIKLFNEIKKRRQSGRESTKLTVNPTGCEFDPHSRRGNIYLNLYFHFSALVSRQSAALSSATKHTMPLEIGRKWMEVLSAYPVVKWIQREADF